MDPSHLSEDFRDFLKCLNDAGVDYLLIGGHAVAFYGYVRPTTDMDIWIALERSNAERATAYTRITGQDVAENNTEITGPIPPP